jgi:hypothetical protein
MSYKDMLLVRSQAFEDSERHSAMDYLALKNREALRAWRVRRVTGGFHSKTDAQRNWLHSWLRPEGPRAR